MTDDAPKPGHEEELAPPASTRWSEEDVPDDDDLAPPFVPGRAVSSSPAGSAPASEPKPAMEDEPEPFPFEQFDIEGDAGVEEAAPPSAEPLEPEPEEAKEPEEQLGGWSPADLGTGYAEEAEAAEPEEVEDRSAEPSGPTEEVAALLERLAGLLREEGADAVRREMDSPDRLTSLLAGLLAGYVSGRS